MVKRIDPEFGENLSGSGKVSEYIKRNSPKMKDKFGGKDRKVKKGRVVVDDKPDWGMKMPKFPSALI